jgi:hypothetical protein
VGCHTAQKLICPLNFSYMTDIGFPYNWPTAVGLACLSGHKFAWVDESMVRLIIGGREPTFGPGLANSRRSSEVVAYNSSTESIAPAASARRRKSIDELESQVGIADGERGSGDSAGCRIKLQPRWKRAPFEYRSNSSAVGIDRYAQLSPIPAEPF